MATTADEPAADSRTDDATTDKAPRRRRRRLPFWLEAPILVVLVLAVMVLVQGFVVRLFVIPSASMETTLHGCPGCTNDRVAVNRLQYRFDEPRVGEVVVFRAPPAWASSDEVGRTPDGAVAGFLNTVSSYVALATPGEQDFVKRVVAIGGQTVACCDARNRVTVDGQPLTETYLHYQDGLPPQQEPFPAVTLGPDELWVLGDNRNNSADSREHGPVGVRDLIGRVDAIVLPLDRTGAVPAVDPRSGGRPG